MMQNQPTPTPLPFDFDYEPVEAETIDIPLERVAEAVRLSQTVVNPDRQWQTYLDALALFGFEQWLLERAPDLQLVIEHCSIFHSPTANLIEAICQFTVGPFKLCLLTTSNLTDEQIQIPKAVVDLSTFAADFYVVVEVNEEADQAKIDRYLRTDQLDVQKRYFAPFIASDCFYSLSRDRFNPDADTLLLELRCLDSRAIYRTPLSAPTLLPMPQLQDTLLQKLSSVVSAAGASSGLEFSELSWAETAMLLQSPDLMAWWEGAQRSIHSSRDLNQSVSSDSSILVSCRQKLSEIVDRLSILSQQSRQVAINVSCWLDDRLDDTAQSLAWMLLPPIVPALTPLRGLRSTTEQLSTVLTELMHQGVTIQPHVRAAYQDLQLADLALRLYAVTWQLSTPHPGQPVWDSDREWTLLLILGTQPGVSLPLGTQLQIQDDAQILVKQILTESKENTEENYLFARVIGDWSEQFSATISLPDGTAIALPPFTFQAQPT